MRVLYRDFDDGTLAVAEVTGTTYYLEEGILQFIGTDRDFGIQADKAAAEKLVRSLYFEGRLDVTGYEPCDVSMLFDDDDFDFEFDEDEDDDEDLPFGDYEVDDEDVLNVFLSDDDKNIRIPRTIRFPGNR